MVRVDTPRYPQQQIEQLLQEVHDVTYDALQPDEKRDLCKETLQFDAYAVQPRADTTVPNPCETTHEYDNPALHDYCQHHPWTENGWGHENGTTALTTYPDYIPTSAAIRTISAYDPIIEIGAGYGYWAYVLSNAGCDVHPTDITPEQTDTITYFTDDDCAGELKRTELTGETRKKDTNDETLYEITRETWFDVSEASHETVANEDRTVLLCHPPCDNWVEELLTHISPEQYLIYVGEWYPGSDATPYFHYELTDWNMVETFPVYSWDTQHAHGYVFTPPT